MEYTPMEQYWIWLSSVSGIGAKRFYSLLSMYEDARSLWDALGGPLIPPDLRFLGQQTLNNLRAARSEAYLDRLFDALDEKGIRAVTRISDGYPEPLMNIYDPPPTLYVRGSCPLDDARMFAIVGSRRCTRDGQRAAREIAEGLAGQDVVVVSGLARGIDTCAHTGALAGRGRTIAVLGCGVDRCYPQENERLMAQILDEGGAVVSELLPGTAPLSGNFPLRNRIISGLSRGVLLVEGAKGSGAMITISYATDQNRDVFAVPGSIYSTLSDMPNQLLCDGAIPTITADQILMHYGWGGAAAKAPAAKTAKPELSAQEEAVLEALREQPLSFDELQAMTRMEARELSTMLTTLQLMSLVDMLPGNVYRAYLER